MYDCAIVRAPCCVLVVLVLVVLVPVPPADLHYQSTSNGQSRLPSLLPPAPLQRPVAFDLAARTASRPCSLQLVQC